MLIDPKKIKPNDGSFKGGYQVNKTSSRDKQAKVIVADLGNGNYMCLDGDHRVDGAKAANMAHIECEVVKESHETFIGEAS